MTDVHPTAREMALVAAGGALGAAARYGVAESFPVASSTFPATTLAVNLTGAFALGLLLEHLLRRGRAHGWIRLLVGIGVLGSFTTFSTFAVEVAGLLRDGEATIAGGYVAASVAGGIAACFAGLAVGGWRRGPVPDEGES